MKMDSNLKTKTFRSGLLAGAGIISLAVMCMAAVNGVFNNITASGNASVSGSINSVGGYAFNGAAPNNHLLVGNGSEYVDVTTLPNASLPNVGTAGTYAFPASITTDAEGRISAITAGTSGGTGFQNLGNVKLAWGELSAASSSTSVTFPGGAGFFSATPTVVFGLDNTGGNGSRNPCYFNATPTSSGFSVASDGSTIQCTWLAIGR